MHGSLHRRTAPNLHSFVSGPRDFALALREPGTSDPHPQTLPAVERGRARQDLPFELVAVREPVADLDLHGQQQGRADRIVRGWRYVWPPWRLSLHRSRPGRRRPVPSFTARTGRGPPRAVKRRAAVRTGMGNTLAAGDSRRQCADRDRVSVDEGAVATPTAPAITIGVVVVASLAALTPSVVHATMTATFERTRSLARSGNRSSFPSANRISRVKCFPSTQPCSRIR
jgi:hypothetical protein